MYKRIVVNNPDFVYAKIQLCFTESSPNLDIDAIIFKSIIVQTVKSLFGEVGASVTVDVLKYSEKSGEAILRIPSSFSVEALSALTLCSGCQSQPCIFRTLQVSPHLMSLAVNSRNIDQ